MKPQQQKLADLHQDYDSMTKFFRFVAEKTKDTKKREKYLLSAQICDSMKEVITLLFEASKELLEES